MTILDLPVWLDYLIKGIVIFVLLAFAGITATKAGRNPYYALLLLYPLTAIWVVWAFARAPWPKVDGK
jgi:hypothetical protein